MIRSSIMVHSFFLEALPQHLGPFLEGLLRTPISKEFLRNCSRQLRLSSIFFSLIAHSFVLVVFVSMFRHFLEVWLETPTSSISKWLEATTSHFPKTNSQTRLLVVALVRLANWCRGPNDPLDKYKYFPSLQTRSFGLLARHRTTSYPRAIPKRPAPIDPLHWDPTWPPDHSMAEPEK